jgi:hypothetical protein
MYPMKLRGDDADLIIDVVNQGIDSHLQAVTESTFEPVWDYGPALKCEVSYKDLSVILRRLMETGNEESDILARDIGETLGLEDLYLTGDTFSYTRTDDYTHHDVSVFDEDWLERLEKKG